MKIITAIVRPSMFGKVSNELEEIDGFPGMTVTDVRGFGRKNIAREVDAPLDEFNQKVRLEIVARDEIVERIVDTIVRVAHTGKHGDGKVFVWRVEQAVHIRTGQSNGSAV